MKTCSYVYILSNFLISILQVNNIHDANIYPNNLITTKCLNTAVMLVTLLIGREHLSTIEYCNVDNTRNRHLNNIDTNKKQSKKLCDSLLSKSIKSSIYYVMLTDGYLYNEYNQSIYFPGHVFIIEKINNEEYYIYQSYIGEYDLNMFLRRRRCMKYSKDFIKILMKYISKLKNKNNIWDKDMINFWLKLTHVNSKQFENYYTNGIYICYRKFSSKSVIKNINTYVNSTIEKINENEKINKNFYDFIGNSYLSAKSKTIEDIKKDFYKLQKYIMS